MVSPQQLPTLIKIKEVLNKGECSIAELQNKTKIKRSTLNYYLQILEKGGFISKKRIKEKVTGRPTIISLDKSKFEKRRKKLEKERQDHLKNPLIQKILINLNNGVIEEKKLRDKINEDEKQYLITSHLDFLIFGGYIERMYKLTSEGKNLLKKS